MVRRRLGSTAQTIDDLRSGFTNDPDGLRRFALDALRSLGEASDALWYEIGCIEGAPVPSRWIIDGRPALDAAMRRWVSTPTVWEHVEASALPPAWIGRFRTTRTVIIDPERTYYPTRFYRGVVSPSRISDQLRLFVRHRGELIAWIGCFRFDGEPDFDRSDQRRVAPIAAALTDALVCAHATSKVGEPELGADLLVTPRGRIEYASAEAAVILARDGVPRELSAFVRTIDRGRVVSPALGGMRVRWSRLYSGGRVRYLLHLQPLPALRLNSRFALTLAQRGVAELACTGLSAVDIAHQLGIKVSTVRSHLKETYERLNVSSRAELASVLGEG